MRYFVALFLCIGCASEPEEEPSDPTCPYDMTGPVDADTGNADLDTFIETAPAVDAEVMRIDGVIRAGCAAIATDLGGDAQDLDTIESCRLAAELGHVIVEANPDVTFAATADPFHLEWDGTAVDPESVDALVATLNSNFEPIEISAEVAEVQEDIATSTNAVFGVANETATIDEIECVVTAVEVYEHAIMVCGEYTAAEYELAAIFWGHSY